MDEEIREATLNDVPRVVELGRKFLAEGPYAGQIKDNPEQANRFTTLLIDNPSAKILVSEKNGTVTGVLAFLLFPHHFSGEMTALEIIWYVEPQYRPGGIAMRLMWTAERIAQEMHAHFMQFTAPDAKASAIYERFGYHQVEIGYQKELRCQS
jgi:N-acetylglutamate synthase-like GNAT family acetyltransferase